MINVFKITIDGFSHVVHGNLDKIAVNKPRNNEIIIVINSENSDQ